MSTLSSSAKYNTKKVNSGRDRDKNKSTASESGGSSQCDTPPLVEKVVKRCVEVNFDRSFKLYLKLIYYYKIKTIRLSWLLINLTDNVVETIVLDWC